MKDTTKENEIGKNILYKYQLKADIKNNKYAISYEAAKTSAGVVACALGLTGLIVLGKMCLSHYSSGEEITYANLFITNLQGTGATVSGLVSAVGGFFAVKGAIEIRKNIKYLNLNEKKLEELEKLESNTEGKARVLKR